MRTVLQIVICIKILMPSCYCNGPASGEAGALSPKDLSLSKALSWLLRHGAVTEGLQVNDEGFIPLEQVLQHRLFTRRSNAVDIRRVVTLSKNRFLLQTNPKTGIYEIRANSGHTFKDIVNNNNPETRALVKINRGRPIAQPGRTAKNHPHSQSPSAAALKNYNLPVGNILLSGEEVGNRPGNDQFMKYPELKKALSWILRYGAEKEGLTVKRHGYVPIEQILNHAYFKNKCMREDLITVANNEPHNFKLREGTHSKQIYIRARKEHPIKQDHEDWSVVQGEVYLPLGYLVHGINGSEWDFVSQHGLKAPKKGFLYFSPYEPADCWHTQGVTKYDDIYVYINAGVAMEDGIEFYRTGENSVTTKGDSEGLIDIQYFKKVVEAKTGIGHLVENDLLTIFKKYGEVSSVSKMRERPFAYIKFADSSSVQKAISDRLFINKKRIFVHKYKDGDSKEDDKNRSRNNSEGGSEAKSVSEQPNQPSVPLGQPNKPVGSPQLRIKIPNPSECPENQNVFEWMAYQIISQIELPKAMYAQLKIVKDDIEGLLQSSMPGCSVFVFGSCGSGLAFKNSDVDLFVQAVGPQPENFVLKEGKALTWSRLLRIKQRIPHARVPIIKLRHVSTGWECDVTAKTRLGYNNSQLIRFLTSLDIRVRPLVMLIKYWAKVCGLTGMNKFTTYSMVMLVVFFLQQVNPPILPSIAKLQQLTGPQAKVMEQGWQINYCEDGWLVQEHCPSDLNRMTLRELLTEFFGFFMTFNYNQVICPLLGRPVDLNIFNDFKSLPPEMTPYKENLTADKKTKFQKKFIMTQDPFELCMNITRGVSNNLFTRFKYACKSSLSLCKKTPDEQLLEMLFSMEMSSPVRSCSVCIEYTNTSDLNPSESELLEWYKLTTESVLFVMREIYKVYVVMQNASNSHKVQKTDAEQDVHTVQNSDDSTYPCIGLSEIWENRDKALKVLNQHYGESLTPFEKEMCVSNLVHELSNKNKAFTLVISSYDNFKENATGLDLMINFDQSKKWTKSMSKLINGTLHNNVLEAAKYIKNNGDDRKQFITDTAKAIRQKKLLVIEEPEVTAEKKRMNELEKQSLLLASIVKPDPDSSIKSEIQDSSETPGPSNPFLNSIQTIANSEDAAKEVNPFLNSIQTITNSEGAVKEVNSSVKPVVINMRVGKKTKTRPLRASSLNRYQGNANRHDRPFDPRPQFRFPHGRFGTFPRMRNFDFVPPPPPLPPRQFGPSGPLRRGGYYNNITMPWSHSSNPYETSQKFYEDDY